MPLIKSHPTVQPQLYAKGREHCGEGRRRVRCIRAPTRSEYFGIPAKPASWA